MKIIEWVMIAVCLIISVISATTDIKKRIIPNKLLYPAFCFMLPLGFVYHFSLVSSGFYLQNILFVLVFSVLLYVTHYFSAGDSKLLIVLASSMPTRLYNESLSGLFPILSWIIVLFSASFIYLLCESIWLTLKREKRFYKRNSIKQIIDNYLYRFIIVTAFSEGIWFLFPKFYNENQYIIILFDYFLLLFLSEYRIKLSKLVLCALFVFSTVLGIICGSTREFQLSSLLFIPFMIVFWIIQSFLSSYNYCNIPTANIESGMILSLESSLLMQKSKVKGLPDISTEDMRSKITEQEAESIRRWEKSKFGLKEITIVRTLPFGALIAVGTIIYIIERITVLLWEA